MTIYDIPEDIIKYILNATDKNKKLNSAKLRYMPEYMKSWISSNILTPRAIFRLIYCGLDELPKCPTCGKQISAKQYEKEHFYCSNKCAQLSPSVQSKVIDTFKNNHNGHSVGNDAEVNNKRKNTNIEKYGYSCSLSNPDVKLKSKQSCLDKYGVDHPAKSEEFQKKRKSSYIKSCLIHYGVENTSQVEYIANKIASTKKDKYYNEFNEILKQHNIELLSPKNDYINRGLLKYKCTTCGTKFSILEKNRSISIRCPNCKYESFVSNKEKEVREFIKTIYHGEIQYSNRTIINPYELDIFIPEKNIAIEFNGVYWHSELFKNKYYHQNKSILCKNQNIRLIHISEYEWDNKKEITKSIIASALGIYNEKIYARDCKFTSLSSSDYKRFLIDNHLQGSINSKWKYGLYYNNEVVAVCGIGKSRFKSNEIELHRCCFKTNIQIIGGFSKLLKNSLKNIKKECNISCLVSYIDLNHFNGHGYSKFGFIEDKITEPNYHYINIKTSEYISRESAQKHKLEKLLGTNFDPILTEHENMYNNNWLRLYNAGNIRTIFTIE